MGMGSMKKIKTYKTFNESLRDKMRGPSDKSVDEGIKRIIEEVVLKMQEIDIPDRWKTYNFIYDNYLNWIFDAIDEGHPPDMYSEVLIELIQDNYYESDEYLDTLNNEK
jgi:hypothetical protein